MRFVYSFLFFAMFFASGLWLSAHSWKGAVYVYIGEDRQPASIRTPDDYTEIPRHSLNESMQSQLLARASILRKEGAVGIQLGHPLLIMPGGARSFACTIGDREGSFDRLEILFTGTGVASNGEPPEMFIDSTCLPGDKPDLLQVLWVPMQDILNLQAKDQEFQNYGKNPMTIRLKQIAGEWPETWVLSKVKMYREAAPEDSMIIDVPQMRVVRGSLLSFDYKSEPNRTPSSK